MAHSFLALHLGFVIVKPGEYALTCAISPFPPTVPLYTLFHLPAVPTPYLVFPKAEATSVCLKFPLVNVTLARRLVRLRHLLWCYTLVFRISSAQ